MVKRLKMGCVAAVAWVVLGGGIGSVAQVEVVKSGTGKTLMDWSEFRADGGGEAALFVTVLRDDLRRSGWFAEAAAGRGELVLQGRCAPAGGRLQAECTLTDRATGRTRLSKAFSAEAAETRRFAHQVADAIVEAITGRRGMAAARFVMVSTRSGKKELYLADADGQGVMQLTRDQSTSVAPKWGPGGQIVYTSFLNGYPDVYLVNIASGQRQRISSYAGLNTGADLSPDGREVALVLSKDGNPELYTKQLTTGRLTRLTQTRTAAEASPTWSPEGDRIAYVSDSSGRPNLYVVSSREGRPRRLTAGGDENVAPDWGSNGRIVYCTRQGGQYRIAVLDPATGQSQVLPVADGANYEDPSWAPDGRHIACTRTANYRSQVYLLDTMGDAPIALSNSPGDWYSPSWSP
jgi:TolB protein